MKKLIIGTDFALHILLLVVGSAFIVYENNYFAGQLFVICWLPFIIYTVFNLANYQEFPNLKQSIYSLLNLSFLGVLVFLDKLILLEFFFCTILAELVAISIAISYFFLFKKGLNDMSAKDLFGKKGAALLALFFSTICYPYIGEAAIYLDVNGLNIYMIIGFVFTLFVSVIRQIKSMTALVNKRNKNPEKVYEDLEEALKPNQPMTADTRVILFSLAAWFLGVGAIYVVFVHNA